MENNDQFNPIVLLNKTNRTPTVPFVKFELLSNEFGESHVYCFVEGHDLPYYSIRIDAILASDFSCHCIDSGGKKNVIGVNSILSQKPEYSKYKILYMVDHDYDDNSSLSDSIYVTPCYSVENLYKIDLIKDRIVLLTLGDPKYRVCEQFINEKCRLFIEKITLFCSWYYCVKQIEQKTHTFHNINLGDNIDSKYLEFKVENTNIDIVSHYSLDDLNRDYNTNITEELLDSGIKYINNDIKRIRGKYVYQFIENLLKFFNLDSCGLRQYCQKPLGINLDRKKLMTTINVIAVTPSCLKKYVLKRTTG